MTIKVQIKVAQYPPPPHGLADSELRAIFAIE